MFKVNYFNISSCSFISVAFYVSVVKYFLFTSKSLLGMLFAFEGITGFGGGGGSWTGAGGNGGAMPLCRGACVDATKLCDDDVLFARCERRERCLRSAKTIHK